MIGNTHMRGHFTNVNRHITQKSEDADDGGELDALQCSTRASRVSCLLLSHNWKYKKMTVGEELGVRESMEVHKMRHVCAYISRT